MKELFPISINTPECKLLDEVIQVMIKYHLEVKRKDIDISTREYAMNVIELFNEYIKAYNKE